MRKHIWWIVSTLWIIGCCSTACYEYGPLLYVALTFLAIIIRIVVAFWGCGKTDQNEPVGPDYHSFG